MKTLTTIITLVFLSFTGTAQENASEIEGITITVTINNCLNDNGHAIFLLHTEETFMKGDGIQSTKSVIEEGKAKTTFENVPKGTYAIIALHDANDNNRMDFEVNGMPKESYGASGNEMSFGPPNFIDAKFEVNDTDLDLEIRF